MDAGPSDKVVKGIVTSHDTESSGKDMQNAAPSELSKTKITDDQPKKRLMESPKKSPLLTKKTKKDTLLPGPSGSDDGQSLPSKPGNDTNLTELENVACNSGLKCNTKVSALLVDRITYEEPLVTDVLHPKQQQTGIYTKDEGPSFYNVTGDLVTPPLLTKNLPKEFETLPVYGRPKSKADLPEFYKTKIKDFIGDVINEEEFENLAKYCSPAHLRTGVEINMPAQFPVHGIVSMKHDEKMTLEKAMNEEKEMIVGRTQLATHKKHQMRVERDEQNLYNLKLKYRGIRLLPLSASEEVKSTEESKDVPGTSSDKELQPGTDPKLQEEKSSGGSGDMPASTSQDEELQPGQDLIFRVRVYRPFAYNIKYYRGRSRHSVFSCDVVLCGRARLSALRDRIVCANDSGVRFDVSNNPDQLPAACIKDIFPSGFLFINNVFYVDTRPGCVDHSQLLREWALKRGRGEFPARDMCHTRLGEIVLKLGHPEGINNVFYVDTRPGCVDHSQLLREWALKRGRGEFPARDMCDTRLGEIVLKLGHPEVYVHQGDCEHLFTFSEIRLLGPGDPLRLSLYPAHTAVSQHQSIYCLTCAEFGAKWIVLNCERVPFDPAFFCDTCFKSYLYKNGEKVCDFKAYSYRGNEINLLKPQQE